MNDSPSPSPSVGDAVELFAGVGGFRLALENAGWRVTWSNQWEPSTRKQHASECYARNFLDGKHVCEDITKVLMSLADGANEFEVPNFDLLVGGFPCQDYSVAKSASQARGIEGKKGVLWWDIHRMLDLRRPRFFLLENVDRLLKSPASQRGRDFAIMLASVNDLGYAVEWRVINAAEYGFPQKRRRVFIVGRLHDDAPADHPTEWLTKAGTIAEAFPVARGDHQTSLDLPSIELVGDLVQLSERFGHGRAQSEFKNAGLAVNRQVWTTRVEPDYDPTHDTTAVPHILEDVLEPESEVPEDFFVVDSQEIETWKYLKGAKHEPRRHRNSGTEYFYTEGAIPYPDKTREPARTILTGEGGKTPSRFKHLIETPSGRLRRLTPRELERLNGFPDDWTIGMPDAKRAFCMGNALVVGVVERIASVLANDAVRGRAATAHEA